MYPFTCVVVAVHRPDTRYLDQQLASLASQTHKADLLVAVIADLNSGPLVESLCKHHGLPLVLALPGQPLDSVNAFQFGLQTALEHSPPDAVYALCDQDDIWHPDRLERGLQVLASSPAQLVHSDARLVDADGAALHPSLFGYERRLRNPGLRGLLYRNTVTGMTVLMRRALVERALPFPRQSGVHFYHDLWLALVAEASGGVALIDQPLVDYRQHGANAIGAVNRTGTTPRPAGRRWKPDQAWLRRESAAYGLARYLAHSLQHRMTTAGQLPATAPVLRPLRRYMMRLRGAGGHLADTLRYLVTGQTGLARLAAGATVVSAGRTAWSLRSAFGSGLTSAARAFDDRLFSLAPGVQPFGREDETDAAADQLPRTAAGLVDRRKSARWVPVFTADAAAITVLVPTLNPTEIFAGIATAVDLGLALAAEGHPVRFIATDLPLASPEVSRQFLIGRLDDAQATSGAAGRITLHCGVTAPEIPAHRDDRFVATAWWTAILAQKLIAAHGFTWHRFVYLIQDYEPGFYPWGTEYADAMSSYGLEFIPIFNTTLLRDHFAQLGHGFAGADALAFCPAIDIARYAGMPRAPRDSAGRRRITVYGRPEVARNLFATAVEALDLFLSQAGIRPDQVILDSVGLRHAPVTLSGGHRLTSRGKLPYGDYPAYLASVDLGLSLMLSPHPSHPPIEMAAAGARVVTNGFGVKDLSQLSAAILSVAPDPVALAAALTRAWAMPPPTVDDRRIDLGALGMPLAQAAHQLAPLLLPAPQTPESRPRRLILHVGAPKCGSTFLQRVLLSNVDRLRRLGIAYPHDGGAHPGNARDLAELTRDRLLADFGTCDTLIYSHEDLLPRWVDGASLHALAAEMGIQVQVLAFLRPFPELMFGTYSQMMKQNFDRFVETGQPYDGDSFETLITRIAPRYEIDTFLLQWAHYFPGPLVCRSDAIRPVVEQLIDSRELDWAVPHDQTNPSLRVEDCDRIAALIREGKTGAQDLRAAFIAAHQAIGQPDSGRTPARIAMINHVFADRVAGLQTHFGFHLPGGVSSETDAAAQPGPAEKPLPADKPGPAAKPRKPANRAAR